MESQCLMHLFQDAPVAYDESKVEIVNDVAGFSVKRADELGLFRFWWNATFS